MNMPLLTHILEISPRPVLIIAGEEAYSRHFSEDAYQAAAATKELMIIPHAVHVNLYNKKIDGRLSTNWKHFSRKSEKLSRQAREAQERKKENSFINTGCKSRLVWNRIIAKHFNYGSN